ncbi:MAG: ABC transporter ATP-binding protein [Haloarculaceae archaeon]
MATIETDGLTKEFGDLTAVSDLDLTVAEGEVFGFLGPNGAGKSTTINLLLDFIRPTAGSVSVFGMDAQARSAAVRQRVGVLPEGYGFDDPLTGREYVEWAIETKAADDDPDAQLELVGLGGDGDRLAADYSKGMQQRLAFAMALVGDPDLLLLDEPSTGLDPNGIQNMREIVREQAADGTTVFFSSHHLSEVQAVCDRVGVMDDGELVAVDTIEGLADAAGGHATIRLECAEPGAVDLGGVDGVVGTSVDGRTLSVECADPSVKAAVVATAVEQTAVTDVVSETASLEELFHELTRGGRDETDATAAGEVAQ